MIFLIGVILVAVSIGIAAFLGSKPWQSDNWADALGRTLFYSGLGAVALSCVIALVKVMP